MKLLRWDTDFFGFNVYAAYNLPKEQFIKAISKLYNKSNNLIYYFSDKEFKVKKILNQYNGIHVDTKVTYRKNLNKNNLIEDDKIILYKHNQPNEQLYNLALLSGKYSRFKDKRLPPWTFEKMYRIWIENACKNSDTTVLVSINNEKINGFVTVKIDEDKTGHIGLIGVAENAQGQGIGRSLMQTAEVFVSKNGGLAVQVPTQKENIQANKFYKKRGYSELSIVLVYHFIL